MDLIALIVFLVIVGLAFWVVKTLAGALGIPPPIVTVIQVLLVVLIVIYLLQTFGLISGGPIFRIR